MDYRSQHMELSAMMGRDRSEDLLRAFPAVAKRANYIMSQQQQRAVILLFVGATCGFLGFAFAAIIGILNWSSLVRQPYDYQMRNYMGHYFKSREPYRPQTVSELVMDPREPSGKAFFGFCLVGAICMLTSWYPWQLRNVYLGDGRKVLQKRFGCSWGPRWLDLRTLCPPIGMLLVACVPTTPPVNRSFGDILTGLIHTSGAVMMIGGYALCEIKTLLALEKLKETDIDLPSDEEIWTSSSMVHNRQKYRFLRREKLVRWVFIALSLFFAIIFQISGAIAAKSMHTDCWDKYVIPTEEDLNDVWTRALKPLNVTVGTGHFLHGYVTKMSLAMMHGESMLAETAYGKCKLVKCTEFWSEVLSGIFMILSHLAIWYYCLERHILNAHYLPPMTALEQEKLQEWMVSTQIPEESDEYSP